MAGKTDTFSGEIRGDAQTLVWESEPKVYTDEDFKILARSSSLPDLKTENENTEAVQTNVSRLKSDLFREQATNKRLRREAFLDRKRIRDEEHKKYEALLESSQLNMKKEFDLELVTETTKLAKNYESQIHELKKSTENEKRTLKHEKLSNNEAKNNNTNENSVKRLKQKYEQEIFSLNETVHSLTDELRIFKEKDFNRVKDNIKTFEDHKEEIKKIKKVAEKNYQKQFQEIKGLQKIIGQLERETGIASEIKMESDFYFDFQASELTSSNRTLFNDFDEDFDPEEVMREFPNRLSTKPHNDPERILYRKYVELCSLVRKLDTKHQHISIKNEELESEIIQTNERCKPLEEKIVQLGKKNMELSQTARKFDMKVKEVQRENTLQEEKLVHLQEVIQRKDKKLQKSQKKEESKVKLEEHEDLQRQMCEQLQIISELRQQNIDKDRRIDVLRKRSKQKSELKQKSRSLQSLDSLDSHDNEEIDLFNFEKGELDVFSIKDDHRISMLTKENLRLQRAYSLLQSQAKECMDPERTQLHRETLKSDLLVSQAIINGLEKQLEEKDGKVYNAGDDNEAIKKLQEALLEMENKKDDFRQKLISAEADLVQKNLQLTSLSESLREAQDHNELLEFQMEEMQHSFKLKQHQLNPSYILSQAEKEAFLTDIDEIECDAINVRISLKEMLINKADILSCEEKVLLTQAQILVEKGAKELDELQENEKNLRSKIADIIKKHNETKQRLTEKENELNRLENKKLCDEEDEKVMSERVFDLSSGSSSMEALTEARLHIAELEYANELLQNKIDRLDGQKIDLSDQEIDLLRQKVSQLHYYEEKLQIVSSSNEELLRRIHILENKQNEANAREKQIPKPLSEEINRLKKEKEELCKELGVLHLKSEDALLMAKQTKAALRRGEQATQTPIIEHRLFTMNQETQMSVHQHVDNFQQTTNNFATPPNNNISSDDSQPTINSEVNSDMFNSIITEDIIKLRNVPVQEVTMIEVNDESVRERSVRFSQLDQISTVSHLDRSNASTNFNNQIIDQLIQFEAEPESYSQPKSELRSPRNDGHFSGEDIIMPYNLNQALQAQPTNIDRDSLMDELTSDQSEAETPVVDAKQLQADNEFIQNVLRQYTFQQQKHEANTGFPTTAPPISQQSNSSSETSFTMYLNESDKRQAGEYAISDGTSNYASSIKSYGSSSSGRPVVPPLSSGSSTERSGATAVSSARTNSACSTCGVTPPSQRQLPEDLQLYADKLAMQETPKDTPRDERFEVHIHHSFDAFKDANLKSEATDPNETKANHEQSSILLIDEQFPDDISQSTINCELDNDVKDVLKYGKTLQRGSSAAFPCSVANTETRNLTNNNSVSSCRCPNEGITSISHPAMNQPDIFFRDPLEHDLSPAYSCIPPRQPTAPSQNDNIYSVISFPKFPTNNPNIQNVFPNTSNIENVPNVILNPVSCKPNRNNANNLIVSAPNFLAKTNELNMVGLSTFVQQTTATTASIFTSNGGYSRITNLRMPSNNETTGTLTQSPLPTYAHLKCTTSLPQYPPQESHSVPTSNRNSSLPIAISSVQNTLPTLPVNFSSHSAANLPLNTVPCVNNNTVRNINSTAPQTANGSFQNLTIREQMELLLNESDTGPLENSHQSVNNSGNDLCDLSGNITTEQNIPLNIPNYCLPEPIKQGLPDPRKNKLPKVIQFSTKHDHQRVIQNTKRESNRIMQNSNNMQNTHNLPTPIVANNVAAHRNIRFASPVLNRTCDDVQNIQLDESVDELRIKRRPPTRDRSKRILRSTAGCKQRLSRRERETIFTKRCHSADPYEERRIETKHRARSHSPPSLIADRKAPKKFSFFDANPLSDEENSEELFDTSEDLPKIERDHPKIDRHRQAPMIDDNHLERMVEEDRQRMLEIHHRRDKLNAMLRNMPSEDLNRLRREMNYLEAEIHSLERQLKYKDNVIQTMQHEAKEENEYVIVIEKKDKEIHLKSETISQITQILERTKKELQVKSVECQRHELTVSQLREELKNCVNEKKQIETRHNEQQVYVTKYEVSETQLSQLNAKYEECVTHNRELIERIKELEISEKEFIVLEKNLIELQVQLRDMEDVEVHRDELMHKLGFVKKQRDEFLEKGRLVEEERNEFVRSNKTLEQYIIEWKRKTAEFKKTNQALKDRILCLEKDKKELEGRVVEVQTERAQLQASLQKVEVERDDLCREFREVTMERNALEARVMDLEDLLSDHDHLEEGFHSLRLKVAELTRQRDDAEMLIPTYKTKVQSLKKHLREKEDNIMQLTHDIKKLTLSIENQTYIDLREIKSLSTINYESKKNRSSKKKESSKIEVVNYFHDKPPSPPSSGADSYEEVLINPVSDTYSDVPDPLRPVRGVRKYIALFDYDPKRKRELRLREGDYVTIYGDIDTDGFYMGEVRGVRGLVPSVYIEESSEDDSSVGYSRTGVRYVTGGSRDRKFIALYDYDPYTMGTTDRPDLQLSLSKGDEMIVVGDVDVDGYYTALQNGKRCLVPSNFVREISTKTQQQSSSSHRVTSDSRHVSPNSRHQNNVNTSATFEGTIELDDVVGPPYAPEDVKVQRVVTRNAVLLGWRLPVIDEYGRSNRCKVTGYRIWVNGKPKQDIKSPSVTKALVDGLDLHGRVEFSVQTVGENGFCSEKCHFAITGALSALSKDNEWHQQSECDLYVALYDYDPFKSSPNPNPSLELKLNEGDLVKVTDKSRSDGFFFGEIKGSKGLVPSNFIEQVNGSSVRKS